MISYNWANTEQVKEIIEKLEPFIFLWRDKSNLTGVEDLWTEIANAITQSEFMIAILSPEYAESDSCTNELNFALNCNIPVIPVFVEGGFKPTGNVGLRTSKLFYLILKDVVQSPLLFVRHLYAMSYKNKNPGNENINRNYSSPCFKFSLIEIEEMIENALKRQPNTINFDINNNYNTTLKINQKIINKQEDAMSINLASPSTDSESDNHSTNSSLNVYCVQSKINGKKVDFTNVSDQYKLGDSMCKVQEEANSYEKNLKNLNLHENKRSDLVIDNSNKSPESNVKHSFQIHQNKPDISEYDLYTREKDELMSFVCQGKEADIEDADYQEVYEIKPAKCLTPDVMMELVLYLGNDYLSCFSLIKDDLLLAASEKGEFHLVRPMKEKWDFNRFTLKPKFYGDDGEHYKRGNKTLIDMCFDAKGNLILLNRWIFKNDNETHDEIYKYTIEMYSFNYKITETIIYLKTLCCFSNENFEKKGNTSKKSQLNLNIDSTNESQRMNKTIEKTYPPVFTRIYNDEKNNCIVLIDSANSKIYWFKKTSGTKKRCLKSQDNSLKDPRAFALSYDEKDTETIFICSSSGIVALNKNFNFKHETLGSIQDLYYDNFEKSLLFIDKRNLYGGRVIQKDAQNESNDKSQKRNTDLRYKCLHENIDSTKPNFSRLISSKNYVFVLSDEKKDSKSSIFAFDKSKIRPSNNQCLILNC